jgi:hypothetical protein
MCASVEASCSYVNCLIDINHTVLVPCTEPVRITGIVSIPLWEQKLVHVSMFLTHRRKVIMNGMCAYRSSKCMLGCSNVKRTFVPLKRGIDCMSSLCF